MTGEDRTRSEGTTRRPLLKLAAGGAALASVGVAARLTRDTGGDTGGEGALVLSTHAGSDVKALTLPLGDDVLPDTGGNRWESGRLPTSTHSMVAFTWGVGAAAPSVAVRSRTGGTWGAWQRMPHLHDVPDEDAERATVAGTDLVWIGRADGIQIRVEGRRPDDLALVLLHPERRTSDPLVGWTAARSTTSSTGTEGADTERRVPQPTLITREQWGANESLRDGRPSYIDTIKQVHVHHTVNSNAYSRDDVPALIRGMYAYHTQTLGWSDIGYNFLVDKFGRAFVGRAGGPARLVRGAHTLGFNHCSTGVSAIGNYEAAAPSDAMLDAIAALAAWKLHPFDRNPRGEIRVMSEGSDKYRAGRVVRLPVIDGHRDTNDTACPGGHLYAALPKVRRRAARLIAAAQQTSIVVDRPATITGTAHLGATLTASPGRYRPEDATVGYRWLRAGGRIRGAREQTYEVRPWDVGKQLTCEVTLTRDGYDPVTQTAGPVGPVTADPVMTVTTSVRRGRVSVRVSLAAPEKVGATPGGRVTIAVGDRSKTVSVEDGRAVARIGGHRRLSPGRYRVRVTYGGDGTFTGAEHEETVTVS